jgi:hypothetical protein
LEGQHSEFLLSGLQNLEQRAKNSIEFRGEHVEKIPSLVAVPCFLPGGAKDLPALPRFLPIVFCVVKPNLMAAFFKSFMMNFVSLPTYVTLGHVGFGVFIFNQLSVVVSLF